MADAAGRVRLGCPRRSARPRLCPSHARPLHRRHHEDRHSMLNFDKTRFVTIQSGAVSIAGEARSLMRSLLAGGVERVFFMGTGGVQLLTLPAIELAQRRSICPVSADFPAQVVLAPP